MALTHHRSDLTQPRFHEVTPMLDVARPDAQGHEVDPLAPSAAPEVQRRRRSDALKLTADEAKAIRIAVRKVARAVGGYNRLAAMLEIPPGTLRRCANPKGERPTGTFAIRLAAVAKVPVEVLLGGKLAVAPVVIGRAA
jgi:hypothetical protein